MPTAKTRTSEPLLQSLFEKVEWAGKLLEVPDWVIEQEIKLYKCHELTVGKLRLEMDDGTSERFSATVVLHCQPYYHDRPYKGGIRLSNTVTPSFLRVLAFEMTFKCAVANIEFGGGKSGIRMERPINQYSPREITRIIEAFSEVFIKEHRVISPRYYVPATDMGTTSGNMDVIHGKYWEEAKNGTIAGGTGTAVTGRTVKNGGSPGREEATALGGLIVLEKLRQLGDMPKLKSKQPTVVVQGLGQVGGNFVKLAEERGYKVVGVSNITGAVYNKDGIDISELPKNSNLSINPNGSLENVTGEHLLSQDIITKPCDILVPAAMENVITMENNRGISAKVILELANHPTNENAHRELTKRAYVVPDIFANAGGVSVSFWEWSLSLGHPRHSMQIQQTLEEVRANLTAQMEDATNQVLWYAKKYDTDLRGAAWLKATQLIAERLQMKHGDRWAPRQK